MPRGDHVKKGMRYGGRQKGTPNRKTTEEIEKNRIAKQAQEEVNKAAIAKVKLGKDVLEDYVTAFHNLAAYYQNRIVKALSEAKPPDPKDLAEFEKWGGLVTQTAKSLADFQSPKFKAIAVMAPPPNPTATQQASGKGAKVIELNDPTALAKVYAQMVKKVG
jgi:hypothetical protein